MDTVFKRIVIAAENEKGKPLDNVIGFSFTNEVTGKGHILLLYSDGAMKLVNTPTVADGISYKTSKE